MLSAHLLITSGCTQSRPPVGENALTERKSHLFGVKLGTEAAKLLAEVESLYGRPVVEKDLTNTNQKDGIGDAGSNILQDGSPVIIVNTTTDKDEKSIVHELYHLKLFAQGYSQPPPIWDGKGYSNASFTHLISALIYDPLTHSLIFPEMRRMGIDPDKAQRETVKQAIKDREFESVKSRTPSEGKRFLAMYYFEFSMNLADTNLLSEMRELYKTAGWTEALDKGMKMVSLAKATRPMTPESMVEVYINCLNILYAGEATFSLNRWVQKFEFLPNIRAAVLKVSVP